MGDGTYRITGQKIFITYGEHDLTDNIIHLVLARLPDAPPGTRGISLFVVPKFMVNADGSLGKRNDVRAHSIEHKWEFTPRRPARWFMATKAARPVFWSAKKIAACTICSR